MSFAILSMYENDNHEKLEMIFCTELILPLLTY